MCFLFMSYFVLIYHKKTFDVYKCNLTKCYNIQLQIPCTCVAVYGERCILVAAKYRVSYPLSAVGVVTGLHFCNPSTLGNVA